MNTPSAEPHSRPQSPRIDAAEQTKKSEIADTAKRSRAARRFDREALWPRILAMLADGMPLNQVCRTEGFPKRDAVLEWAEESPLRSRDLARARDAGCDALADECIRIADDLEDDPASRRVRCEVRLKLLACRSPRYRPDSAPSTTVNVGVGVTLPDSERERLIELRRTYLEGKHVVTQSASDTQPAASGDAAPGNPQG